MCPCKVYTIQYTCKLLQEETKLCDRIMFVMYIMLSSVMQTLTNLHNLTASFHLEELAYSWSNAGNGEMLLKDNVTKYSNKTFTNDTTVH